MEVTLDIVLGSGPELGDGELDDGDEGSDDDGGDTAALVFGGRHPFDSRPLPVLHCVGWFDNILIPSMRDYTTLIGRAEWAPLQFLWADSVDHENYHLDDMPITADNDHGLDDAVLEHVLDRYATPALDFFDVFVKGIGDAASLPRVWWHLGHVGYRSSPAWPPVGATERRLHLGDLASAASIGGTLGGDPVSQSESVQWAHDPGALVPSAVTNSFSFLYDYPDERAVADRDDVITFSTAAMGTPVDLAGPVELHMTLSSTCATTDIFAKLMDVDADGAAHMIVRGQGQLRADSYGKPVRIGMGHTGYRMRPGHRMALWLSSSDFPEFVPHPGTSEDRWRAVERATTQQTLLTSPESPAYLSITVLPADAMS